MRPTKNVGLSVEKKTLLRKRLAQAGLETNSENRDEGLRRRNLDGPVVLSFAQQRLWFMHQIAPKSAFYNIPLLTNIKGTINEQILEASLRALCYRHEILRTSFPIINNEPVQVVAEETDLKLQRIDLTSIPPANQHREVTRLANEEAQKP